MKVIDLPAKELPECDGWIKWAGGECPVDSDAIVEVKCRHPSSYQFNNDRAGDFYWPHDGLGYDIIAYRLRQPTKSEQVRSDAWRAYAGTAETDDEAALNECIGQGVDMPEWNGDGVPPVGVECEFKCATGEWVEVEITAIARNGLCFVERGKNGENYVSFSSEFRPLRTEAEMARDKLAESLHIAAGASPIELNGIGPLYFKLADAIISGSVFGTTFKAGK